MSSIHSIVNIKVLFSKPSDTAEWFLTINFIPNLMQRFTNYFCLGFNTYCFYTSFSYTTVNGMYQRSGLIPTITSK